MVEQITLSVVINQCRVVSGSAVPGLVRKLIITDKFNAITVVILAAILGIVPDCIRIWAVYILRAEQAHIVTTAGKKPSISLVHIVVTAFLVIEDIRPFAGLMVTPGNMCAEIAVNKIAGDTFCSIFPGIFDSAGSLIQLMNEDTTRP